ncbi:MAG: N(G),N(G)-dimethylarginine dimethylaminohydrolase [Acidimicrobiales bacterium]|nr:N(G),N(G)-dimethylarginine dimethylaminohydrolase [Acidimicrobiales bacterium]MCB9392812.1 N(G),N(G)-dimethylarginine dimethylaminohydrolase [Acidimicrobiaceae bacterium]
MVQRTALVRRPSPRLAEGLVTHIERSPIDLGLALRQWEAYVDVLREAGWRVVEVPEAPDCPDSVFVEDTVVMFRNVAVICRPGADERKPEVIDVEKVVEDLGCSINRIRPPGTLDGGDVLKVGDTVYVGRGGRTNGEGIRQLRAILEPLGASVVAVPLTKVLHLKSAVTALPDGTVIGEPSLIDDRSIFPRFVPVPEEDGAHVVLVGGDRLLMSAAAPRSAALLRDLGYTPVEVDISEFVKLEGCVTCLSVRLRH